jgi:tetratricopeptide (TPR) repeat protein
LFVREGRSAGIVGSRRFRRLSYELLLDDPMVRLIAALVMLGGWDSATATAPPSDFFPKALTASGVEAAQHAGYRSTFQRACADLQHEAATAWSARDRAAAVQAVLHRHWLTGPFDEQCDSIAVTLDEGRYNCVTATILFAALADTIDLPVQFVHAPGHVYLRVAGESPFDVEPTAKAWFARSQLASDRAGRAIDFDQLLGKLYYNRGVKALGDQKFSEAIAALRESQRLDRDDAAAKKNLAAALSNAALASSRQGAHGAADALAQQSLQLRPDDATLAGNAQHVERQWAIALCEQGKYSEALALFARGKNDFHRAGQVVVNRLWAEDLIRRGETHAALSRIAAGLALAPDDARLKQLEAELLRTAF